MAYLDTEYLRVGTHGHTIKLLLQPAYFWYLTGACFMHLCCLNTAGKERLPKALHGGIICAEHAITEEILL